MEGLKSDFYHFLLSKGGAAGENYNFCLEVFFFCEILDHKRARDP